MFLKAYKSFETPSGIFKSIMIQITVNGKNNLPMWITDFTN